MKKSVLKRIQQTFIIKTSKFNKITYMIVRLFPLQL